MTGAGAPGTAADGFRVEQPTIPIPREQSDPAEPGRRTRTQPRHEHEETRNA